MTTELLLSGLMSAILAGALAWCVFTQENPSLLQPDRQRYLPLVSGAMLPTTLTVLLIISWFQLGPAAAVEGTLSLCFGIFLHILLYDLILLGVLPLLRRQFRARDCALLWLLPNYLYLVSMQGEFRSSPLVVIRVSQSLVNGLLCLWAVGFLGVLGWKILTHLLFRIHLLRKAVPVTDPQTLEVWEEELLQGNFKKPKFRLVSSPTTATPLSIGLLPWSTRVVLPQREYSQGELALIFRHELVHIGREDCWAKFFLVFCTAMCWFNPLMWVAMKKSAGDLELSCDEMVLEGFGPDIRRQYANLLLTTAGDQRGFTTCLSATASALRYRLKNVVDPPKRRSGALLVGLVFFALSMTCGYGALAYGSYSGAQVVYQGKDPQEFHLRSVTLTDDPYHTTWLCPDPEAFQNYMSSLELTKLTGSYTFQDSQREFTFIMDTPQGEYGQGIVLQDRALKVVPFGKESDSPSWYYLPQGADWEGLSQVLLACPSLNLSFREPDSQGAAFDQVSADLYELTQTTEGETTQLIAPRTYAENANGVYAHGLPAKEVALDFSYPLAEDFTVEMTFWDGSASRTLTQSQLENPWVLPLPGKSATYILRAALKEEDGAIFRAVFRFAYGEPNETAPQ